MHKAKIDFFKIKRSLQLYVFKKNCRQTKKYIIYIDDSDLEFLTCNAY